MVIVKTTRGGGCKASKTSAENEYTVVKKLGAGAFGEVYLVKNIADDLFAMKKMIVYPEGDESINTEIRFMKLLDHPNIVRFYESLPVKQLPPDIKDHPDYEKIKNIKHIARQGRRIAKALTEMENRHEYSLLLEYCHGGDLVNYLGSAIYNNIRSGVYLKSDIERLESNSKIIMFQILHGIKYLHEKGIIHRDLKPENILLKFPDSINCLKIADFGIAVKYDDDPYCCSEKAGTSVYMAPEIFTSTDDQYDLIHKYGETCDLWSIGIIFYQLLSLHIPFPILKSNQILERYHDQGMEFIRSHFRYNLAPTKLWEFVSDEAKQLLNGLLQIDPENRWTCDRCLASDWLTGFRPDIHPNCETPLIETESECELDELEHSVDSVDSVDSE